MADIDIGAITEALNDKADVDLGNANKELLLFVGMVAPFAGTAAPAGWLKCDGSAISRTTYAALFAVIGTTYGAGDGSTTFNLPPQSVLPLGTTATAYVPGASVKTKNAENGGTDQYFRFSSNDQVAGSGTVSVQNGSMFLTNQQNTGMYFDSGTSMYTEGQTGYVDLTTATGAKAIVCIKY